MGDRFSAASAAGVTTGGEHAQEAGADENAAEMTLHDRAVESDKEVIRLASLLTEARTLLADLEAEAGLMIAPALTERIETWRGKEWSEEGGIHDSGFLYWMHRCSGLIRERNDLLEELGRLDPELEKAKRLAAKA